MFFDGSVCDRVADAFGATGYDGDFAALIGDLGDGELVLGGQEGGGDAAEVLAEGRLDGGDGGCHGA